MSIQPALPLHPLSSADDPRALLLRRLYQLLHDPELFRRDDWTHHRRLVERRADAGGDACAFGGEEREERVKDGLLDDDAGACVGVLVSSLLHCQRERFDGREFSEAQCREEAELTCDASLARGDKRSEGDAVHRDLKIRVGCVAPRWSTAQSPRPRRSTTSQFRSTTHRRRRSAPSRPAQPYSSSSSVRQSRR